MPIFRFFMAVIRSSARPMPYLWRMTRTKILIAVACIAFSYAVSAQEQERRQSVGIGFSAVRMDFFFQGNYQVQRNKWEFGAGAGIGIIRSIFQGRIFPQATLRSSYYWLNRPAVQLGPTLSLNYAGTRLNNQYSKINFWQQYYLGYSFTAGKRLKFVQITEIGPQLETYYTSYDNRYKTAGTLGYSLQLGLRYVL